MEPSLALASSTRRISSFLGIVGRQRPTCERYSQPGGSARRRSHLRDRGPSSSTAKPDRWPASEGLRIQRERIGMILIHVCHDAALRRKDIGARKRNQEIRRRQIHDTPKAADEMSALQTQRPKGKNPGNRRKIRPGLGGLESGGAPPDRSSFPPGHQSETRAPCNGSLPVPLPPPVPSIRIAARGSCTRLRVRRQASKSGKGRRLPRPWPA